MILRVADVPVAGSAAAFGSGFSATAVLSTACEREVFAHDTNRRARHGWTTTRGCARSILWRLTIDRVTVAAVARHRATLPVGVVGYVAASCYPADSGRAARRCVLKHLGTAIM